MLSFASAFASARSSADLRAIPIEPISITANSIAAWSRPKTVCAYPGMKSELRKARRGVIGGFGVSVAAGCGAAVFFGAATPARALSRCCATDTRGRNRARQRKNAAGSVAGECGNRTHPTLRSRVTVILKITEATRPHPPPRVSMNFDRNFSPFDDLAHDCRSLDA